MSCCSQSGLSAGCCCCCCCCWSRDCCSICLCIISACCLLNCCCCATASAVSGWCCCCGCSSCCIVWCCIWCSIRFSCCLLNSCCCPRAAPTWELPCLASSCSSICCWISSCCFLANSLPGMQTFHLDKVVKVNYFSTFMCLIHVCFFLFLLLYTSLVLQTLIANSSWLSAHILKTHGGRFFFVSQYDLCKEDLLSETNFYCKFKLHLCMQSLNFNCAMFPPPLGPVLIFVPK